MPRRICSPSACTVIRSVTSRLPSACTCRVTVKSSITSAAAAHSGSRHRLNRAKRSTRNMSKLHFWRLGVTRVIQAEVLRLGKGKGPRHQIARHRLNQHIQLAHCAVVVTPGHLYMVLDVSDVALQV